MAVSLKSPLGPGSDSTDGMFIYCRVVDVDLANLLAHVVDQLGGQRIVSITRSMGKQVQYPAIGETWIITRQYGDWMFSVLINGGLVQSTGSVPTGGAAGSVLSKNSVANFDDSWVPSTPAATANAIMLRDANGRSQVAAPAAASDIANKSYADTGDSNTLTSAENFATAADTAVLNTAENFATNAVAAQVPSGCMMIWATATPPTGWFICNGQAVSRTTYASLFALFGTSYGIGDGTTTFNLPNLQGRTAIGSGTATGAAGATAHGVASSGGEETHVLTTTEMPAHNHNQDMNTAGYVSGVGTSTNFGQGTATNPNYSPTPIKNTGGGAAHNNMMPFLALNYIVKT